MLLNEKLLKQYAAALNSFMKNHEENMKMLKNAIAQDYVSKTNDIHKQICERKVLSESLNNIMLTAYGKKMIPLTEQIMPYYPGFKVLSEPTIENIEAMNKIVHELNNEDSNLYFKVNDDIKDTREVLTKTIFLGCKDVADKYRELSECDEIKQYNLIDDIMCNCCNISSATFGKYHEIKFTTKHLKGIISIDNTVFGSRRENKTPVSALYVDLFTFDDTRIISFSINPFVKDFV